MIYFAMNNTRRLYLPLMLALVAWQSLYFFPRLPPVVASHFGGQGHPNGWMSRDASLGFHLFMVGLMTAIFFGLPRLLRRLPVGMINLPHREYWLAPERAESSLRDFEHRFNLFGLAVIAFLTAVMQLVYSINLNPPPRLPTAPFISLMGAFVAALIFFLIGIYRRFGKPPG
jgi:uncharacterized membrane protein